MVITAIISIKKKSIAGSFVYTIDMLRKRNIIVYLIIRWRFVASRRRLRRRSGELRRLRDEDRGQIPDASGFEQLARTVRHVFRVRRPTGQVVLLPSQRVVLQKRLRQVTAQQFGRHDIPKSATMLCHADVRNSIESRFVLHATISI